MMGLHFPSNNKNKGSASGVAQHFCSINISLSLQADFDQMRQWYSNSGNTGHVDGIIRRYHGPHNIQGYALVLCFHCMVTCCCTALSIRGSLHPKAPSVFYNWGHHLQNECCSVLRKTVTIKSLENSLLQ